jgi:GT2 family glycosyltransferase
VDVSVLVASRGPAVRLRRLLDSLSKQTVEHETLVVDNGSARAEVTALCAAYPFATAIPLEENKGFSLPVNLAARAAQGEVIVLVNDDCVCDPGFVAGLAGTIDAARGVVMAAGVMRDHRDPTLIDTAGMQLDRTLLVYDYLNGEPLSALAAAADPIGPSAAAAAFDRSAFLSTGGFDERLFAYWEDVDLVLRLLAQGGRCRLAAGARGTHEHSATLGSGSAAKNDLMGFGRGYVFRKWRVVTLRAAPGIVAREAVLLASLGSRLGSAAGARRLRAIASRSSCSSRAGATRSAVRWRGGLAVAVACGRARTRATQPAEAHLGPARSRASARCRCRSAR